jgi:hypothetical protein
MPCAANQLIPKGTMVSRDASSRAVSPSTADASGFAVHGVAAATYDNRTGSENGGAAGAIDIELDYGVHGFAYSGSPKPGDLMYAVDNQTISPTASSRGLAGSCTEVRDGLCWIVMGPGADGMLAALATHDADVSDLQTDALTAQARIDIPLTALREASTFNVGAITANGGVLASDTTPVLSAINGATDGCQRVLWAASNGDQVVFQISLPADLDDTADLKLYTRIASAGTTDAVGFTVKSFFDEGDTAIDDTSATNQTATYANKLTTIGNADVPAGATTLTIGLTPVAHTTNTMALTAVWLEYQRKLLTS